MSVRFLSLCYVPEENISKQELAPTSFRVLCPWAVGELSVDDTYFLLDHLWCISIVDEQCAFCRVLAP